MQTFIRVACVISLAVLAMVIVAISVTPSRTDPPTIRKFKFGSVGRNIKPAPPHPHHTPPCYAHSTTNETNSVQFRQRPLVVFFVGAEGSGHHTLLQFLGAYGKVSAAVPLNQRNIFESCVDHSGLSTTDRSAGDRQLSKLSSCLSSKLHTSSRGTTIVSPSWPYGSNRARALKNGWQLLPILRATSNAKFRVKVVYMYRTPSSNYDMRWGQTKNWQQSFDTRSFYLHKLTDEISTLACFKTLPFYPFINYPDRYVDDVAKILEVNSTQLYPSLVERKVPPGLKRFDLDVNRSNLLYVQALDKSLSKLKINPLDEKYLLGPNNLVRSELDHLLKYAPHLV